MNHDFTMTWSAGAYANVHAANFHDMFHEYVKMSQTWKWMIHYESYVSEHQTYINCLDWPRLKFSRWTQPELLAF